MSTGSLSRTWAFAILISWDGSIGRRHKAPSCPQLRMNSANQLTQVWQAATLRSRSCEMLANLRENGRAREGFDVQVMPSTCPQASKLRSNSIDRPRGAKQGPLSNAARKPGSMPPERARKPCTYIEAYLSMHHELRVLTLRL